MGFFEFISNNSNLIADILAICVLICSCLSFFMRKKILFFSLQTAVNVLTVFTYFLRGNYSASIGCLIAIIRTVIFTYASARNKNVSWIIVFAIIGATIASCVATYVIAGGTPFYLIYMAGLVVFTLSFKIKSQKKMRYGILVATLLYCVYNLCINNPYLLIKCMIELGFLIISIIREIIIERKEKAEDRKEIKSSEVEDL